MDYQNKKKQKKEQKTGKELSLSESQGTNSPRSSMDRATDF